MFLQRNSLSRRALLRGSGIALALPFWTPWFPRKRRFARRGRPRAAAWYASKWCTAPPGSTLYGGDQNYWSPRKSGVNFDLSYSLELLHAFREYLTIVSNTDARPAAEAQARTEGV